jgi:hypothetical protein
VWHHSSVEVVGSQTGEFLDPPQHATQGEDFGGLIQCSQELKGNLLQGSNRSNSSMRFGAVSTTIHHPTREAGSGGTTCPQTQGKLRSTSGFIAPPEGRAPEAPRDSYASPCMQLYSENCGSILCLFLHIYLSCGQLLFFLSHLLFELCNPITHGST